MEINGYKITGIDISSYQHGKNLAIILKCLDDGTPSIYAVMTVNLDIELPINMAFVDTNNCPWATSIIEKYELGKPLNVYKTSGFCAYPLYKFDIAKLKELDKQLKKMI